MVHICLVYLLQTFSINLFRSLCFRWSFKENIARFCFLIQSDITFSWWVKTSYLYCHYWYNYTFTIIPGAIYLLYSLSFIAFLLKNWSVVGIYSIMVVLLLLFLIDYEFDFLLLHFISLQTWKVWISHLFFSWFPLECYMCVLNLKLIKSLFLLPDDTQNNLKMLILLFLYLYLYEITYVCLHSFYPNFLLNEDINPTHFHQIGWHVLGWQALC